MPETCLSWMSALRTPESFQVGHLPMLPKLPVDGGATAVSRSMHREQNVCLPFFVLGVLPDHQQSVSCTPLSQNPPSTNWPHLILSADSVSAGLYNLFPFLSPASPHHLHSANQLLPSNKWKAPALSAYQKCPSSSETQLCVQLKPSLKFIP